MKAHCNGFTRLLLAALVGLASMGFVQAETVIHDQFGLKERVSGLALNKTPTESGDTNWQASANVLLGGEGDNGYVTVFDNMPFAARVPVSANAKVVAVEAKLQPITDKAMAEKGKSNWIAIGIGNPQLGTPPWGKGVFITIDAAGNYNCMGDTDPADFSSKATVKIKSGKAPEFTPDGQNRLKLEYSRDDNMLSAWVNGIPVIEKMSLEGKGLNIEPVFAGFSGFFQQPKSKTVTDFTVTHTP